MLSNSYLKKKCRILSKWLKKETVEHVPFRKLVFKNIVKDNKDHTELIEKLHKGNPLTEDDIVMLVRDVDLSDRKVLKILKKIRQKWGNEMILCNAETALRNRKKFF